ncbi:MAG: hypothetical protein ABIA77_05875 [Candidatus Omnitrophota bacterium]
MPSFYVRGREFYQARLKTERSETVQLLPGDEKEYTAAPMIGEDDARNGYRQYRSISGVTQPLMPFNNILVYLPHIRMRARDIMNERQHPSPDRLARNLTAEEAVTERSQVVQDLTVGTVAGRFGPGPERTAYPHLLWQRLLPVIGVFGVVATVFAGMAYKLRLVLAARHLVEDLAVFDPTTLIPSAATFGVMGIVGAVIGFLAVVGIFKYILFASGYARKTRRTFMVMLAGLLGLGADSALRGGGLAVFAAKWLAGAGFGSPGISAVFAAVAAVIFGLVYYAMPGKTGNNIAHKNTVRGKDIEDFVPPRVLRELLNRAIDGMISEGKTSRLPGILRGARISDTAADDEIIAAYRDITASYEGFSKMSRILSNEKPSDWIINRIRMPGVVKAKAPGEDKEKDRKLCSALDIANIVNDVKNRGHIIDALAAGGYEDKVAGFRGTPAPVIGGRAVNMDIISAFTLAELDEIIDTRSITEEIFEPVVLMDTYFRETPQQVRQTFESAVRSYNGRVHIVLCMDDDDLTGYDGIMNALAEGGELHQFADNIIMYRGSNWGMNLGKSQRKFRMKPVLNVEAVQFIKKHFAEEGKRIPGFVELVDQEDRLGPLLLKSKSLVWRMQERAIADVLDGRGSRDDIERWGFNYPGRSGQAKKIGKEYRATMKSLERAGGGAAPDKDGNAAQRAAFMLARFTEVYADEDAYVRSEFKAVNLPAIIQAELRLVPLKTRTEEYRSHSDYLLWHTKIQVGQTVNGFLFLGGTGNGFRWDMLAGEEIGPDGSIRRYLNDRARLQDLLMPLRQDIRKEETRIAERGVTGRLGAFLNGNMRRIRVPGELFNKHLNLLNISGTWDSYNIIEDAELGSRLAMYRLSAARLTGDFTEVLENLLPAFPKWWPQRSRWITPQAVSVILAHPAAFFMFCGQYVSMALGWCVFGSSGGFVLQGLVAAGLGYVIGGWLFYWMGRLVNTVSVWTGLKRNAQWQVDPVKSMGYWKFQHIAHLAAAAPAVIATFITLIITLLYGASVMGFFDTLELAGAGIGLFITCIGEALRIYIPLMNGWLPLAIVGAVVFLVPPFMQVLQGILATIQYDITDESSTTEAVRTLMEESGTTPLIGIVSVTDAALYPPPLSAARHYSPFSDDNFVLGTLDNYIERAGIDLARAERNDPALMKEVLKHMKRYRDTYGDKSLLDRAKDNKAEADLRSARVSIASDAFGVDDLLRNWGKDITKVAEGELFNVYKRALGDAVKHARTLQSRVRGDIKVSMVTGSIAGIMAAASSYALSRGLILPGLGTLIIWMGAGYFLAGAATHLLNRIPRGRGTGLWAGREVSGTVMRFNSAGRLPGHMYDYLKRQPSMLEYFMNLIMALPLLFLMVLSPYHSEGFWLQGRQAIQAIHFGAKRTKKDEVDDAATFIKTKALIFIFLFMPFYFVVAQPSVQVYLTPEHISRTRAMGLELEYQLGAIGARKALTMEQIDKILGKDRFADKQEGFVLGKLDEFDRMVREGNRERWEVELALKWGVQGLLRQAQVLREKEESAGDKQMKEFDALIEQSASVFYRRGIGGLYEKIFGEVREVPNAGWSVSVPERGRPVSENEITVDDGTFALHFNLGGRYGRTITLRHPADPEYKDMNGRNLMAAYTIYDDKGNDISETSGILVNTMVTDVNDKTQYDPYRGNERFFRSADVTVRPTPQEMMGQVLPGEAGQVFNPRETAEYKIELTYPGARVREGATIVFHRVWHQVRPADNLDVAATIEEDDSVSEAVGLAMGRVEKEKLEKIEEIIPEAAVTKIAAGIRIAKEAITRRGAVPVAIPEEGAVYPVPPAEAPGPHPFKAVSGYVMSIITGGIGCAGISSVIFSLLLGHPGSRDFLGLGLAGLAFLSGIYFAWASYRFLRVGMSVQDALLRRFSAEGQTSDAAARNARNYAIAISSVPYHTRADELLNPEISPENKRSILESIDKEGQLTEVQIDAFLGLIENDPKTAALVITHEKYSHYKGLAAMFPGAETIFAFYDRITGKAVRGIGERFAERETLEREISEFNVMVGMPSDIFMELGEGAIERLERALGVSITPITASGDQEAMIRELEAKTAGRRSIAALLDISEETSVGEIEDIISELKTRAVRNIIELTHPEIAALNAETIGRIKGVEEMRDITALVARMLPDGRSYRLSEKSIYQLRVERSFNSFQKDIRESKNRVQYLPDTLEKKEEYYLIHYADGDEVLSQDRTAIVPVGLEIQKRRGSMNVTRDTDTKHDKFFVMAPENLTTPEGRQLFRSHIVDRWMLEGVVSPDDVVILDNVEGGYATHQIYDEMKSLDEKSDARNTGIRCIAGALTYGKEAESRGLLQVQLAEGALNNINQYEILVNLLLSGDAKSLAEKFEGLERERGLLFIYIPQAKAIDFEAEVRNYQRYMLEVLVKA